MILTGKNAVVEDVQRDDSAILGGGGESRVIVDAQVMLEPQDGRTVCVAGCHFGCKRGTTASGT